MSDPTKHPDLDLLTRFPSFEVAVNHLAGCPDCARLAEPLPADDPSERLRVAYEADRGETPTLPPAPAADLSTTKGIDSTAKSGDAPLAARCGTDIAWWTNHPNFLRHPVEESAMRPSILVSGFLVLVLGAGALPATPTAFLS